MLTRHSNAVKSAAIPNRQSAIFTCITTVIFDLRRMCEILVREVIFRLKPLAMRTWVDSTEYPSLYAVGRRSLLIAIALTLTVLSPRTSLAEGKFLSSAKLQKEYALLCPERTDDLRAYLRGQKTKVAGTSLLVIDAYKHWFVCNYGSDSLYKSLSDAEQLRMTETSIGDHGKDSHIKATLDHLAKLRLKYQVDSLRTAAATKTGLTEHQVKVLIAFARAEARSYAVVRVLQASEKQ